MSKHLDSSLIQAGKGGKLRPVDREGWENSKLWDNLKKQKEEKKQKNFKK